MTRHSKLTDKQLAVLRWVADGRPKGVYDEGFEHRITARAVERRGLLSIRGHGSSWRAEVTMDGRHYLEHDSFPPSDAPEPSAPPHTVKPCIAKPAPVLIDDLIARLEAASGVIRIESPTEVERISYRHAVEQTRASGEVLPHRRLKLSGTKSGPLVVELLAIDSADELGEQIPVPTAPDAQRPEVRALQQKTLLIEVSPEVRPRALALVQAVVEECARRGWSLKVDEEPSFLIVVGEDEYRCVLHEEREKRDVVTDEDLEGKKYAWQRVTPVRREVFTGRLRLDLGSSWNHQWWADRRRWRHGHVRPRFSQGQASWGPVPPGLAQSGLIHPWRGPFMVSQA